jgi:hypothetical protein
MNRADLTTDWGIRMLSNRSPLFEPLNYNYGACWPFLSGWVAAALFEYGFLPQGYQVLLANVRHTFDNDLGTVMELFSGHQNAWPQEGVPHQGFSSTGVVLPLVRGLIGLSGNALARKISFDPCFPANWPAVSVENWKVGPAVLALEYARKADRVTLRIRSENAAGFDFAFGPAFGLGTTILGATRNGVRAATFPDERPGIQAFRAGLSFPLTGDDTVELRISPAPEIVAPAVETATGDLNKGLRVIRTALDGRDLKIDLEGLAGETYVLDVVNEDRVESVAGAGFDGRRLKITFPTSVGAGYIAAKVTIRVKA